MDLQNKINFSLSFTFPQCKFSLMHYWMLGQIVQLNRIILTKKRLLLHYTIGLFFQVV